MRRVVVLSRGGRAREVSVVAWASCQRTRQGRRAMNCACTEENGRVVSPCGAHAEWGRAEVEYRLKMKSGKAAEPFKLLLYCPECGKRHIDAGEFATKVHHTHSCQYCGLTWRPAIVAT